MASGFLEAKLVLGGEAEIVSKFNWKDLSNPETDIPPNQQSMKAP